MEKRIGLLFAMFLLLLSIAALRATWLGTVRSGSLSDRAVSQQIENVDDPAQRGTIYDRNGVELAVSEDSTTVFANPMQIKDPAKVAAQLAPLMGVKEDELLRKLSDRTTGRSGNAVLPLASASRQVEFPRWADMPIPVPSV